MSSRGRSAVMSSMRTPGKSLRWIALRSEPLPLTRSTAISRPRWSRSRVLIEVLPPPQITSEVSAPTRRDAYTRRSRPWSGLASASFQRERMPHSRYHERWRREGDHGERAFRQPHDAALGARPDLHRQPCRRLDHLRRREPPAAAGDVPRQAFDRAADRRDARGRRRPRIIGPDLRGARGVRGAGGGRGAGERLARARGDRRRRDVLHVGHHGSSQGRRLYAPRDVPALSGRGDGRSVRDLRERQDPAHRADVPRQLLVPALYGGHGGRRSDLRLPLSTSAPTLPDDSYGEEYRLPPAA